MKPAVGQVRISEMSVQRSGDGLGGGLSISHRSRPTRLKWHRLRRSLADPVFSLDAMREGFRIGASMELDLRVRRDGGFVVLHDETLDRETNGEGLIRTKTRAELSSWSFRDHSRPMMFSEDLADLLQASHPDASLQFDMKDDLATIGTRGVDHLALYFRDKAASLIVSGECLRLIAVLADRLPEIRRGIDPTDRLSLVRDGAGLAAAEAALRADLRGETEPVMVYLSWPLLLDFQENGLDLVALCHAEGKLVDAWTYTPPGLELGLSRDDWRRLSALLDMKPDQITTDEAVALEREWLVGRA